MWKYSQIFSNGHTVRGIWHQTSCHNDIAYIAASIGLGLYHYQGHGNDFFPGGGGVKNVYMPSDNHNLGGHMQAYPVHAFETKSWGGGAIAPP